MLSKTTENDPLLSVIIPAYNVEKYIEQCIESILNQTFSDFELIIADDCSSDKTRQLIDLINDDRIVLSHNTRNKGKTHTVNRLFKLCKGQYVTIHDSDDWSHTGRFEKQINWLEQSSCNVMCGTGFLSYNCSGDVVEVFKPNTQMTDIEKAIIKQGQFHGPTMIFKKNTIEEGIYRDYFNNYCEDTDLAYRLFQMGNCTNIDEPLYYYRILLNSLCRKEFTTKNKCLYQVVVHLAEQRSKTGVDDLMKNNIENVDKYFSSITAHYKKDKGLIYREGASYYMYWKYYIKAMSYSLKSIASDPKKFINWKTFIYCFRKWLVSFIKVKRKIN